jgi:hypothetical protein
VVVMSWERERGQGLICTVPNSATDIVRTACQSSQDLRAEGHRIDMDWLAYSTSPRVLYEGSLFPERFPLIIIGGAGKVTENFPLNL